MASGETYLVVPSVREAQFTEFMREWRDQGGWDRVVLVQDGPTADFDTTGLGVDHHLSWASIERAVSRDAWIFSKRDSAVRAFGILFAWHQGAAAVLNLDDDVRPFFSGVDPDERDLVYAHEAACESHPRWVSSIPGTRLRGLPYKNLGCLDRVMMNVGLWARVGDFDAVTTLYRIGEGRKDEEFLPARDGNWLVPQGQYAPVCGMNLYARREALPLMYFPLMGEGERYGRMDDIWMGVLAKKVMDHLGWHLSVGRPWVDHMRASNPFTNIAKEGAGLGLNERLWELVDGIQLSDDNAVDCMIELGTGLSAAAAALAGYERGYVEKMGRAIVVWAKLFEAGKIDLSDLSSLRSTP